uniref:Group II intron maturase-specific domain protein n=1 Tax=Oedocladium carolinianum TaxID=55992 RepID=A0A1D8GXA3_9CHLO|nr:group II intron maturase-specific domain protein [Oedocladium carolinianum]AOT84343.1 group II intron maturase-specific domain protein [Oedocladium carolinianum]
MINLTKEYLSLLQYLIYKAQKRQKIKQILKCQKIFYKSKSIILYILRYKYLTNFERKKIQNYLSEPIFQKLLKICILKKQMQICFFFNSKLQSKNKLKNFIENFKSFSVFTLFWDSIKKETFSVNLVSLHHNIKLSYLSFFNNCVVQSRCAPSLKIFQYTFLLLLPMQNILLFDVCTKKEYILKKNSIIFKLEFSYPFFHYQTFYYYYFYHHNYFIDNEKIKYQNSFYFDLLVNRKQQFFSDKKLKKKNTQINKNTKFLKNLKVLSQKEIFKNNKFFYYSMIYNFPYFRKNSCFFSPKLLNTLFFKDFTKIYFFEIQLNNIQKQILLLLFEPIWEAYFEITSYSNRPGRSIYDAIEFIRLHLKKQPMFLFKIYLNLFYKMFSTEKKIYSEKLALAKRYIVTLRVNKRQNFKFINKFNRKSAYGIRTMFFCFFENIYLYGIQKKYQNYYLRTKQQIFLYQIIKIFKQNKKKNDINFYKIFYNQNFSISAIHNQIKSKCKNKKLRNNTIYMQNFKNSIRICKQFILDNYQPKNFYFNFRLKELALAKRYTIYISGLKYNELIYLKSKKILLKNFLIFSLSNFFFEKINNLKQRLFGIEIKKQNFPFYLQKLFSIFPSVTSYLSKIKGVSFSMIFKDSNFFVSKNTFLFFFIKKNKKVFYNIASLDQWSNNKFCFFKKIQNKIILLKKLQSKVNNINKLQYIFVFSKKLTPACWNYQILLKINLVFISSYSNSLNTFLDLASFHNIFLKFLLFIKNIHKIKRIKSNCIDYSLKKFFSIIYYCNFYGKFFSFFKNSLKKKFIVFLLEKNDIQVIWKIFIKYENQILVFNSNYVFLKSFQTILKKWMIFNKSFLFFYMKNNKKFSISRLFRILFYSKSFILNYPDWLIISLKNNLNKILFKNYFLNYFSTKLLFLNNKKEKKYLKCFVLDTLWSIKFFVIKQKHTFFLYNKNVNGFDFFDFFMFHKKKNNNKFISNNIVSWLFYFIKILKKFKYIESFINYYEIYRFTNQKENVWKKKKIKQILQYQKELALAKRYTVYNSSIYPMISQSRDYFFKVRAKRLITFSFFNQNIFSSFQLFKLIFSNIFKDKYSLNFYKKLILQQKLKFYYYFSIKPSKSNIQKHLFQIHKIVKKSYNKTQEYLIYKLSKIIKNWCFYYQSITSTIFSKYLDYLTLQILWGWACKRHYQKSKKWIKRRYFYKFKFIYPKLNDFSLKIEKNFYKNQRIIFASKKTSFITWNRQNSTQILLQNLFDKKDTFSTFSIDFEKFNFSNKITEKIFICLPNHTDIILIKHQLIQNDRSPFDGDFIYWVTRHFYD